MPYDYKKITGYCDAGLKYVVLKDVSSFDASMIFDCGQAFRFDPVPGTFHEKEWCGAAMGRFISVAQDGADVTIYNSDEADFRNIWERYFMLDVNYSVLAEDILSRSDTPALKEAVENGRGIRILRQDPWEALCSFIISQNNNIPRIKGLIRTLSEAAGDRLPTAGMEAHGACGPVYAFPSPAEVAALGEQALKDMKTGFRAGYIHGAASAVSEGTLSIDAVCSAGSTGEASAMLQTLRGVGPKVAACALLFGFGRMDAFPVDVWIKKVIAKYFPGEFSPELLGPYAGLAQQYLFYYERWLQNG